MLNRTFFGAATATTEIPKFEFNPQPIRFPFEVYIPSLQSGWVVFNPGDSKSSAPEDLNEPTVYFTAQVYAEALYFFTEAAAKTGEAAAFFLTEKIMPAHPQFLVYDMIIPGQSASAGDVDIYGEETLKYAKHLEATYPQRFKTDIHRYLSHGHSHPGGAPSSWSGTDYTQQTEKTQMGKQSKYRIFLLWQQKECMQASMWVYDPWAAKLANKMRLGLYFGEGLGVVTPERRVFIDAEVEKKVLKKHLVMPNGSVVAPYEKVWRNGAFVPLEEAYGKNQPIGYPSARAVASGAKPIVSQVAGQNTKQVDILADNLEIGRFAKEEMEAWEDSTRRKPGSSSIKDASLLLLAVAEVAEESYPKEIKVASWHSGNAHEKYLQVLKAAMPWASAWVLPKHVVGLLYLYGVTWDGAQEARSVFEFSEAVNCTLWSLERALEMEWPRLTEEEKSEFLFEEDYLFEEGEESGALDEEEELSFQINIHRTNDKWNSVSDAKPLAEDIFENVAALMASTIDEE